MIVNGSAAGTASAPSKMPATPGGRARRSGRSISSRVKDQRARYADAVLRSVARSQRGRPVVQIQQQLRNCLSPLGVRLPVATLHQLATDIAAGYPVTLSG